MNPKNRGQVLSIIGAALAISIVLANTHVIYGSLSAVFSVSSTGTVQVVSSVGIKVCSDSQCQNNLSSINWGTLSPGGSKSVTVYVKNTGNVALTLSVRTDGWNPANASTYLTLSWDYANGQVQPNAVLAVTLTLAVSSNIQGISSYSFNIYITGTQVT